MGEYESYKKHRAGMAAVLSFILSGLGQIYIGQLKKGLTIIFWSSLFLSCLIIGAALVIYQMRMNIPDPVLLIWGSVLVLVGLIANSFISIYNIYNAYNSALKDDKD